MKKKYSKYNSKPVNDLQTSELTAYIWGRRGDLTEKGKVAETKSSGTQALPPISLKGEERGMECGGGMSPGALHTSPWRSLEA